MCVCVSHCVSTSPLQQPFESSAWGADDSPSLLESLRSLIFLTEWSDRESSAGSAATKMFWVLIRFFYPSQCFCCQLCLFAVPSLRYPPVIWRPVKAQPIWPIWLFISVPAGNIRGTSWGPDGNDLSVNELLPEKQTDRQPSSLHPN